MGMAPTIALTQSPGGLLQHLIRNERIKLAAAFLNGLGMAAVTVGFLAPVAADMYRLAAAPDWTPIAALPLWFMLAAVLHWGGHRLLGDLR